MTAAVTPAAAPAWRRCAATAARLLLAGVWIVAGSLKAVDLDASVRGVRAYRLLPEVGAQIIGAGLPLIEICIGVLLLAGLGVRIVAVLSALMFAMFIVGISSAWARGLQIDCGCFGSGGELSARESPGYGWELARDAGLLLVAAALARYPASRFATENVLFRARREAGVYGKEAPTQ
jgi:uncharacterized membrane protein YphA (DoxX/SURF4 family)